MEWKCNGFCDKNHDTIYVLTIIDCLQLAHNSALLLDDSFEHVDVGF